MSQQIRPSLQEHHEVSVGPLFDTPDIRRTSPTADGAVAPRTSGNDRSRLGTVLVLVGTGLLMQGAADALARNGHESPATALFLLGIALQFAACAWRLTSAQTARRERVWVCVVLGLGLFGRT